MPTLPLPTCCHAHQDTDGGLTRVHICTHSVHARCKDSIARWHSSSGAQRPHGAHLHKQHFFLLPNKQTQTLRLLQAPTHHYWCSERRSHLCLPLLCLSFPKRGTVLRRRGGTPKLSWWVGALRQGSCAEVWGIQSGGEGLQHTRVDTQTLCGVCVYALREDIHVLGVCVYSEGEFCAVGCICARWGCLYVHMHRGIQALSPRCDALMCTQGSGWGGQRTHTHL